MTFRFHPAKTILSGALFLLLLPGAAAQRTANHPYKGAMLQTQDLRVTFIRRLQNYNPSAPDHDPGVMSPKSVHVHPSGQKYYINSLEGCLTLAYDFSSGEKLATIRHDIGPEHAALWAPASGLFPFHHTYKTPDVFTGKPVESTFSHNGHYLWVPYYRRSFDINAQDPSALAVIDTEADTLVRLFETGPLPKMIATSPDGTRIAVTHWGDNTVGMLDISSDQPEDWHYSNCYIVDYQLQLNFSLTAPVNRDRSSGYCLRGTLFTPDGRYLLVGCMGGGGGIAVIDIQQGLYLGRLLGMMPNLRHIIICGEYLYASINNAGYVQRIPLSDLYEAIGRLDGKTAQLGGWVNCKVPAGARTITASPDGRYIYVACHAGNCLAVVDAASMKLIGTVPADSFPVGLDVSKDGRYVFLTSQAEQGVGGNAVDIYRVEYLR